LDKETGHNAQICSCGAKHEIPVKTIDVGEGALGRMAQVLSELKISENVLIVADTNTWEAAGSKAEDVLKKGGFSVLSLILDGDPHLRPDELAVESVLKFVGENQGILVAAGSGTINDLVRHAAKIHDRKYISVATAPSMDGYASVISALTVNGVKKTFYGKPPLAIIADTGVIAKAPRKMVMAGFGDMLAKIVSIADWRLGIALMDEKWCSAAALMSIETKEKVLKNTENISKAKKDGIYTLTEALVNSGMAIIIAGQTRPASGAEHHFAHYLEMKLAMEGKPEILHGIKVGLGTLCSIAFYNSLSDFDPDSIDSESLSDKLADDKDWEKNLSQVFGCISDEIISATDLQYRSRQVLKERLVKIKEKWHSDIKPIIDDVPAIGDVLKLIELAGYDYSPKSLGLTVEEMNTALNYAMEVRPRYTVFRLMDDLGLLKESAAKVSDRLFAV
jgi:glycerol-1-phosphate dehydrogenase [NAD(P)+]